jgi:hypothetical protein
MDEETFTILRAREEQAEEQLRQGSSTTLPTSNDSSAASPASVTESDPAPKKTKTYHTEADWAKDQYTLSPSHFLCQHCDQRYVRGSGTRTSRGTSSSVLVDHLLKKHSLEVPTSVSSRKQQVKNDKQAVMATFLGVKGPSQRELLAVAYCFNPRTSFSTFDEPHWKAAFKSSIPSGMNSHDISSAVREVAGSLRDKLFRLLKGAVVGLQMDGGKDVNGRKLLATCFAIDGSMLMLDLTDTDLQYLDGGYYRNHVKRLVRQLLEEAQCFVVSVTLDNESSPNAGLESAIENELPWVVHIRCGAHTIELMLETLAEAFPDLQVAFDQAAALGKRIKNDKVLLKQLKDLQIASGVKHPLVLFGTSNTRKWSAGFLMISRALQLKPYLTVIESRADYDHDPTEWSLLQSSRGGLFQLYYLEQILQRDGSNVIHLAWAWRRLTDYVEKSKVRPTRTLNFLVHTSISLSHDVCKKLSNCPCVSISTVNTTCYLLLYRKYFVTRTRWRDLLS